MFASIAPKLCPVVQFGTKLPTCSPLNDDAGGAMSPCEYGIVTSTTNGVVSDFTARTTKAWFVRSHLNVSCTASPTSTVPNPTLLKKAPLMDMNPPTRSDVGGVDASSVLRS